MRSSKEREVNQKAYRRMKTTIARTYPQGRFVAIHGGKVVADAPSFDALDECLTAMGLVTRNVLIVEAGVSYPDYVTILLQEVVE